MNVLCKFCFAKHWLDEKISRSSAVDPLFGSCCLQGKVRIDYVDALPQSLHALFFGDGRVEKEFRSNIRRYNKAFAFTSSGGSWRLDGAVFDGRGPPTFKIQGELYHQIGPLEPDSSSTPLYSQLYILDPDDALQRRMGNNRCTAVETMTLLQQIILDCNPFVRVYCQAKDLADKSMLPNYYLKLDLLRASDQRRYNRPSGCTELAAIIPGDVDSFINSRQIVIRRRGGALMRITEVHPAYVPLHFPLLAPTGQMGWHPEMQYTFLDSHKKRTRKKLTFCDFLKHRLHVRPTEIESDHYFKAGLLYQEYLVDMWAAAEHARLDWIRTHQTNLRAELYSGLVDALREGLDPNSIGRKVILPATFTSGPWFMQKNLQNALALLRVFKGSDLFITFTANPAWPEVVAALLPGQTASERPDIVARVFFLKFMSLLNDVMKRRVFGHAVGYVYTVEYQKRGLPHIHLIVFLHPDSRLSTSERVDTFISTEFPDSTLQPELFELVKTHMVHGPCGKNTYSSCLNEKKECSKGFPKPFQAETEITGHSYVKTRRRVMDREVMIRNVAVDNRSIVSYSPYLLQRYRAHINVECTTGFNAIKYIYKVRRLLSVDINFVHQFSVCIQRPRPRNNCCPRREWGLSYVPGRNKVVFGRALCWIFGGFCPNYGMAYTPSMFSVLMMIASPQPKLGVSFCYSVTSPPRKRATCHFQCRRLSRRRTSLRDCARYTTYCVFQG